MKKAEILTLKDMEQTIELFKELDKNKKPLGEIHIVETLEGRLHLSSKVFEREEIIGALHVLTCMMLNEENQDCDYDIYQDDFCKMIFALIQQRNVLKDKLNRWLDLLSQDGKNTKLQVKNEIKAVLEDLGDAKETN